MVSSRNVTKINDSKTPCSCLIHGQWSTNADSFPVYELGAKRRNLGGPSSHPGHWTARSGLKAPDARSCPTPQAVCVLGRTPWAALPGRGCPAQCRPPSPPREAPSTCPFPQPGLLAQLASIRLALSHSALPAFVLVYASWQTNVMSFPRAFFLASSF